MGIANMHITLAYCNCDLQKRLQLSAVRHAEVPSIWVPLLCPQMMEFLMHTIHPLRKFKRSTTGTSHRQRNSTPNDAKMGSRKKQKKAAALLAPAMVPTTATSETAMLQVQQP